MDEGLSDLTVRELIMRLAVTEETIRRTTAFTQVGTDRHRISDQLVDLAQQEQRLIGELRQREYVVTPVASWSKQRQEA